MHSPIENITFSYRTCQHSSLANIIVFVDETELTETFSSNLKKFRTLKGLTQFKLAEKADISVGYLCDLESGKKWGTAKTVAKLSDALGVFPHQLFEKTDNSNNKNDIHVDLADFSKELKTYIDERIAALIAKY